MACCEFSFLRENGTVFTCSLEASFCSAIKYDGSMCYRQTLIGLEYCPEHLGKIMGLQIRPSTITGAGLGLFAVRRRPSDDQVVFPKGHIVCPYEGNRLSKAELDFRYGGDNVTAPYAIQIGDSRRYIDAACRRGVGAMVNHSGTGKPNVKFDVLYAKNGKASVVALSLRNILEGEEILADYGEHYDIHQDRHRTKCGRAR